MARDGRPVRRRGDRIEIRGLRVLGVHGVLAHERETAQPFSLDLDVAVDMSLPGGSDDLSDTVDYSGLVERAASVVAGPSFQLLEALAEAVAQAVLGADPRIQAAGVSVRKLRPPVAFDVQSVGVSVLRSREPVDPEPR